MQILLGSQRQRNQLFYSKIEEIIEWSPPKSFVDCNNNITSTGHLTL